MKRGSLHTSPTVVIVASTARQADQAAQELGLHRWRYAGKLADLAGVKADSIVIVTPPTSTAQLYWLLVEEVHRAEAKDGTRARRVTL